MASVEVGIVVVGAAAVVVATAGVVAVEVAVVVEHHHSVDRQRRSTGVEVGEKILTVYSSCSLSLGDDSVDVRKDADAATGLVVWGSVVGVVIVVGGESAAVVVDAAVSHFVDRLRIWIAVGVERQTPVASNWNPVQAGVFGAVQIGVGVVIEMAVLASAGDVFVVDDEHHRYADRQRRWIGVVGV